MIGIFGKTLRNHKKDTNEKLSQSFMKLITRLIVIDIAPLTLYFIISRSLICDCPLLKDITFNTN